MFQDSFPNGGPTGILAKIQGSVIFKAKDDVEAKDVLISSMGLIIQGTNIKDLDELSFDLEEGTMSTANTFQRSRAIFQNDFIQNPASRP
jgi:hypothetical protein